MNQDVPPKMSPETVEKMRALIGKLIQQGVHDIPQITKTFSLILELLERQATVTVQLRELSQKREAGPAYIQSEERKKAFELETWKDLAHEFEIMVDKFDLLFQADVRTTFGYGRASRSISRRIERLEADLGIVPNERGMSSELASERLTMEVEGQTSGALGEYSNGEADISALAAKVKEIMRHRDMNKKEVAAHIKRDRGTLNKFLAGAASAATKTQVLKFISKFDANQHDST